MRLFPRILTSYVCLTHIVVSQFMRLEAHTDYVMLFKVMYLTKLDLAYTRSIIMSEVPYWNVSIC